MREVSIANQHPRLRLDRRAVTRVIQLLEQHAAALAPRAARPALPAGELSLVFLTDPALARLHADFLDDPTITDVITFEGEAAFGTAGEICVSVDAAVRQTSATPTSFSRELTLYLVHGWLHLAGHDDLQPVKKRAMRRAEARALRLLDEAGAVPRFQLQAARVTRKGPR